MTKKSREKLTDYLEGFNGLAYDGITPIGAVLIDQRSHNDSLTELKSAGFTEISDNDLELKLAGIAEKLAAGEQMFINLTGELPAKALNFFLDMTHGKISGAKFLFVMPAKLYDSHALFDRIISSVCRL